MDKGLPMSRCKKGWEGAECSGSHRIGISVDGAKPAEDLYRDYSVYFSSKTNWLRSRSPIQASTKIQKLKLNTKLSIYN